MAVQKQITEFVGIEPDEGESNGVSNPGSQSRCNHIAANKVGNCKADHEVKTDKWGEGRKHARCKAHRDHMRRRRQSQNALGDVLRRAPPIPAWPQSYPEPFPEVFRVFASEEHRSKFQRDDLN